MSLWNVLQQLPAEYEFVLDGNGVPVFRHPRPGDLYLAQHHSRGSPVLYPEHWMPDSETVMGGGRFIVRRKPPPEELP